MLHTFDCVYVGHGSSFCFQNIGFERLLIEQSLNLKSKFVIKKIILLIFGVRRLLKICSCTSKIFLGHVYLFLGHPVYVAFSRKRDHFVSLVVLELSSQTCSR